MGAGEPLPSPPSSQSAPARDLGEGSTASASLTAGSLVVFSAHGGTPGGGATPVRSAGPAGTDGEKGLSALHAGGRPGGALGPGHGRQGPAGRHWGGLSFPEQRWLGVGGACVRCVVPQAQVEAGGGAISMDVRG